MAVYDTDLEELIIKLASEAGFESIGAVDASKLIVNPAVRDMCAADRCRAYGRNWMCPPHCGELEEFAALIGAKTRCVIVQTVGELEDEFDFESMVEAEKVHKVRFRKLSCDLRADEDVAGAILPLAAGTCTLCPTCSCPDEPCRHPKRALVSMEAAGLLVSEVCTCAGVPYNHGKGTIAYTSCILL